MNILISGSSGLVGSELVTAFSHQGYRIKRMVRHDPQSADEIQWNPETGVSDKGKLEGMDAVVHLAGESIAEGRWNEAKKKKIRDSRVDGTSLLSQALARLSKPPKVFVCASASGYYGNRGDEVLLEDSAPGTMFLSHVCREWEEATSPAAQAGIRVINLRSSIILTAKGGALKKMLPPFKLGAGGKVGSGHQWWSWIALDDVIGIIDHVVRTDSIQGPVNNSTPNPVTNEEFTRTLAKVLHRPAIFPIPRFAARKIFGEMADELLLCSFRMQPAKLIASGYVFKFPDLESALLHLLG
jgi:uncharacterized protein (TIGR01777 family)